MRAEVRRCEGSDACPVVRLAGRERCHLGVVSRLASFVHGTAFAVIGARFALGAGGVLEIDRIDMGVVAGVFLFMAHAFYSHDGPQADDVD